MYASMFSSEELLRLGDLDIKERLVILEDIISNPQSECTIETLLDILISLMQEFRRVQKLETNENILNFFNRYEQIVSKLQILRRNSTDFSFVAQIGRGAFGRVNLVREKATGRVLAMKVMHKTRMISHRADFWAERQIMSSSTSPWIVRLYYAFQDVKNLYMVMEYVPGGNLVSWMDEIEVLSEAVCRFYAAEVVLALTDLHKMGFIHRDLKPDNLLLDAGGHVKLADFGTSIFVDPDTCKVRSQTAVGTPDYISPEVLLSQSTTGGEYGFEVDWWALGVLIYEMLFGETPFYSESLINTYSKIMSYQKSLNFDHDLDISSDAVALIKHLLCDRDERMGVCPDQPERHIYNADWFALDWAKRQQAMSKLEPADLDITNWTWDNIRASPTPFQPQLSNETDVNSDDPEETPVSGDEEKKVVKSNDVGSSSAMNQSSCSSAAGTFMFQAEDLNFAGFSFASSQLQNLSLFADLYSRDAAKDRFSLVLPQPDSTFLDAKNLLAPLSEPETSDSVDVLKSASTAETSLRFALLRLETQLEDALHQNAEYEKEIEALSDRIHEAMSNKKAAEAELASRDVLFREQTEEHGRVLQTMRAENVASLTKLEAEIDRWKALAEQEECTRRRATEMADRVASRGSTPGPMTPASNTAPSTTPTANSSDSLLVRVRELAERAQRAEKKPRNKPRNWRLFRL
ncbi:CDC42 binding protein kinase [Cichlidogyrus casuarinus]|uniref:non-specific serine/threonine protein kinase n=1 Tax=Cichlidogyrus casuarinus TaxID=1844966 RepID=A0ABD2Q0T5_9PLAT